MIKVDKSKVDVPSALTDKKANRKRKQLLRTKQPWNELNSAYKEPLKNKEVIKSLESIYQYKCCYCEQEVKYFNIEGSQQPQNTRTVEHYRPKSLYRWLTYSWDNLLLCCKGCNNPKDNDFPFEGTQITTPRANDLDAANIHNLAVDYNAVELPLYPHPELENPISHLTFDTKGLVHSENHRYQHLIKICGLNERELLVEARKKIYDDFKTEYDLIQSISIAKEDKVLILKRLVGDFAKKCITKQPFTAYRLYLLKNIIVPLLAA